MSDAQPKLSVTTVEPKKPERISFLKHERLLREAVIDERERILGLWEKFQEGHTWDCAPLRKWIVEAYRAETLAELLEATDES